MDGTASGMCPMASFSISNDESLCSPIIILVNFINYSVKHNQALTMYKILDENLSIR